MKFLGIDYGTKRVGVAVSDDDGKIAFPRDTFSSDAKLAEKIEKICAEEKVGAIVIGESKDFAGADNPIMPDAKKLAEELKEKTKLTVHFEPEFLTSREAARIQGEVEGLDASAAAIILQSFLDRIVNRESGIGNKTKNAEKIPYEDFAKVEIRVGKILTAEKIVDTDKLLKLEVDFGDTPLNPPSKEGGRKSDIRNIVSGIALYFPDPFVLVGKNCLFVTNLEPRVIRGEESNGMILALSTPEGAFSLLEPKAEIPIGTKVR